MIKDKSDAWLQEAEYKLWDIRKAKRGRPESSKWSYKEITDAWSIVVNESHRRQEIKASVKIITEKT